MDWFEQDKARNRRTALLVVAQAFILLLVCVGLVSLLLTAAK